MKSAYRVLAYAIALLVMLQAAFMALAVFGVTKWVGEGGVLDNAALESGESLFPEEVGFMLHAMVGLMLIPLVALILLIVSFFAKIPGGAKWGGFVLLAVVAQVLLGMFAHGLPALGALHGFNALVIFGLAVAAGMRVGRPTPTPATAAPPQREHV